MQPDLTPDPPLPSPGRGLTEKCVLCVWCGQVGDLGHRPGWCALCAPDPSTTAWLAGQVRQRVRQAIKAGRRSVQAERKRRSA